MKYTEQQNLAIYTKGSNILVSAGAGSGKTAVLTERIFRMLESGVDISELLVLTFTKAAALEMKTRIKKIVLESGILTDQLDKIDSAFITTFDAFSLSVVKKYHYILNLPKDISIIDSSVMSLVKKKILDDIILKYYQKEDEIFFDFLTKFTKKNDNQIIKYIYNIANEIEKIVHKDDYLNNYVTNNYNEASINNKIVLFTEECNLCLKQLKPKLENLYDLFYGTNCGESIKKMLDFVDENHPYMEIVSFFEENKLAAVPKNFDPESVQLKNEFAKKDLKNYIEKYLVFNDLDEIKKSLLMTKDTVELIINIIKEYYVEVSKYKRNVGCFEFNDIAMMSLELVENYKEINDELKNSFKEILVDEYQDTSDIQEAFIISISNNNVYMVGDIKQSIYRFRYANPYIFKQKYIDYENNIGGIKIDLLENFRSRSEVLDNINTLFSELMTNEFGDADYSATHQMIWGQKDYQKFKDKNINYNQNYLVYEVCEDKTYTKAEIEIFTIAEKIIELMNNNTEVYDKETKTLRKLKYSDIAILLATRTNYELVSKIFSYKGIPLNIVAENKLASDKLMRLFINLFNLVSSIKNDSSLYPYHFVSVARSFLFEISDNAILKYSFDNYKNNEIFDIALRVCEYSKKHSPSATFEYLLKEFNVYEKLIAIGDIDKSLKVIAHVSKMVSDLSKLGYSFDGISNHLKEVIEEKIEIKSEKTNTKKGVNLMSIHMSKGLEFPICFFADLYVKFNLSDMKEQFLFNKNYGLIVPYFDDKPKDTIDKILMRQKYLNEEISEKIRLFYVALTRAREKMYFVMPSYEYFTEKFSPINYSSFADFVIANYDNSCAPYVEKVNYKEYVSKDYLSSREFDLSILDSSGKKINYDEVHYVSNQIEKGKISKELLQIKDGKTDKLLSTGTRLHEIFENINLKTKDLSNLNLLEDDEVIIKRILQLKVFENINDANIYKELEFIYQLNDVSYHGIIDLLLEFTDYFVIIDYKLYNVDKEEYNRQLTVYYNYLKSISDKPVKMYLLSLLKAQIKEVEPII